MGGGTDGVSHEGSVAKVNGNRNVSYLNKDGSKRNLNLNWWNDDWSPDYRFLAVRHFHVSPALTSGSFVLQLLAPSAKHFADFRKILREAGIFFRIKSLHFPRELNKQLQKVNARDASVDEDDFLRMGAIAREKAVLDRMEEYVVYLRPECKAIGFRKMCEILLPETIRILQLQYDGDKFRLSNRRGGVRS